MLKNIVNVDNNGLCYKKCLIRVLDIVYIHVYNISVSLLLQFGLDWSRRLHFINENVATGLLISTGLIFLDLRHVCVCML